MSELKPCPFCGGKAELCSTGNKFTIEKFFAACCVCGVETPRIARTRGEAKAAWNRRAQPANDPLTCGECAKYQTPDCAAKHEQALMDFCSHGIRKPGGEQE